MDIARNYRHETGWVNFGQKEDAKKRKQRYESVMIHDALLRRIEEEWRLA